MRPWVRSGVTVPAENGTASLVSGLQGPDECPAPWSLLRHSTTTSNSPASTPRRLNLPSCCASLTLYQHLYSTSVGLSLPLFWPTSTIHGHHSTNHRLSTPALRAQSTIGSSR
ncbi:uncharacterized protein TrAFT101_008550 [Trichoderma asperellum]|uniref:uncharacterized protein n=1 Tax=Trichoderma asperellum TaxID=101201 RepID=UPI00331F542C|nr:hypothetical protein TrAFT101_008550 [Trichoderma asperellum]